jgi:hypothetical protein
VGEETQALLARLRVGVVGLGSVGSIVAESLAREFEAGQVFDLICLARSPEYTPVELDPLFDEIRAQLVDDKRWRLELAPDCKLVIWLRLRDRGAPKRTITDVFLSEDCTERPICPDRSASWDLNAP